MAKAVKALEAAGDAKQLEARFLSTLSAANSHKAKPAAVEALKASLEDCRRAGIRPWGVQRNPINAARELLLMRLVEMVGPAMPEVWREQARDLRSDLGYDSAPALERILIDHAVLCWLRLGETEMRRSAMTGENTYKAFEYADRRLTAAQKRFTRACESLARVRRLARPNVQVNIAAEGGRQINVA